MELKRYVRRGKIAESFRYNTVMLFGRGKPQQIMMLLEGRARRKLELSSRRVLYENYYPTSFVGLEDFLLGWSRQGGVGVYPGSHYVLWDTEDFMNAVSIQPELARRAINELSRRIRIYDSRSRTTDMALKREPEPMVGSPEADVSDALYEMSFAEDDEFPPHLVKRLSREFGAGEYLMRQGELSQELFIILRGEVGIFHGGDGSLARIDSMKEGCLVGEMAQFDGLPRSAHVIADTAVRALEFRPENFHMLFQLHPKWTMKLLSTLAERVEQRRESFETIELGS